MPANLSPEYKKAEQEYKSATTSEEKMAALERMMAVIPKHKGTEKMQADLKKRLSKLREMDEKSGGKRGELHQIRREGAAQAVMLGAPNCGKSLILRRLTNAKPDVGDYPFTTTKPLPGMMEYEDIKIQLVDTGPIADGLLEPYHKNLARAADLLLIVIDLAADDPAGDFKTIKDALSAVKVELARDLPEETLQYGVKTQRALIVANKADADEDDVLINELRNSINGKFDALAVSALNGDGIEGLRRAVFDGLDILRAYSKIPGKPPDIASPFVLKKGETVMDFARHVHKEIAEGLRYARIWGDGLFEGQMVQRDYKVRDRDVIELHV